MNLDAPGGRAHASASADTPNRPGAGNFRTAACVTMGLVHRPRGRIWISVALVGGFAVAGQAQGTADHPHPSAATSASSAPAARSTPHTVGAPPQTVAIDRIAPARARAAETPVVGAQVNYVYTSPPLPRSFLGTSVEYPALHVYAGRDPNHVDPVFINLLRGLVPGQPAIMRIGGDSADDSW